MLSKELLGLAAEYCVASELCKRGVYAQLTLGPHKRTDILVESERDMLRIQVKGKQGREWPAISGVRSKDDFLVLVDFEKKAEEVRPDFYVLGWEDWRNLVLEERDRVEGAKVDEELKISYPDGWKGLNISRGVVILHKEAWEKVLGRAAILT